jgi:tetratricopeptide (TPR) repeat protein
MATVQFRTALLTVALASLIAAPTAIAQKAKPKAPAVDDSDKEMQLRMRLNMNPHDEEAHRAIQALLRKKYAFHTSMEEDGIWLKNNPDDYNSEIEMRSVAMTINDPEYAIGIDRYILAHANRAPNPEGYDSVSDRLAFLLIGRGKYPEALILLKRATELSPTDAGRFKPVNSPQPWNRIKNRWTWTSTKKTPTKDLLLRISTWAIFKQAQRN